MTLEDFFTLAEMKSGLTTLARVEELISRMQQQNDSVSNNVGDTARQRSTVASTLAATECKDCLEHFVKLNGLCFLNQWLQEALKGSNDIADSAFEELMHALLGSLEKLPVDQEQSFVSGIHTTIEQLFGLKGLYKERARALFEKWNNVGNCQDIVRHGTSGDDKQKCSPCGETIDSAKSTHLDFDNTPCTERTKEGSCRMESAATEDHHSDDVVCHEASRLDRPNDVLPSAGNQILPSTSSSTAEGHANLVDTRALSSVCPADEMTSTGTWCAPNATVTHIDDITCDSSTFKDSSMNEMKMEVDTKEGNPCKSGQQESCKVLPSSTFSATLPAQKPERSVSCNFEFGEHKTHVSEDTEPLPRSASVGCVAPKYLRTMGVKSIRQESNNGSEDNNMTTVPRKQVMGNDSEDEELGCASKLILSRSDSLKMERMEKRSDLGLEDGELDALEVARQVAIEVEREVVDYREPFCSSSPESSSGNTVGPQSSLVVDEHKQDQPAKEEINGKMSLPDGASSPKDERLKILETDIDPDTCGDEMPKRTTDAIESSDKSDGERCDFDLNEDVGNEEHESSLNPIPINSGSVSAPIAVAASKGTPLFPVAPVCFEGELGWRGSAATSAFHPASPWRTDTEKTHSGQKRKSNLIEIDLNIAESGDDDMVIEPIAIQTTPVSSSFRSQDESMEVSSKRADKLKLDLNCLGDEDVSPDELSVWRLPHHNGDQALSPASSSSSRQPSTRDFDLNDNPRFLDAVGSHNQKIPSARAGGSYESSKFDASAITIMGSRMVVERKDYLNDPREFSTGSRPNVEPFVMMASRPMLPYSHIPLSGYAYNGQVMGPPMSLPTSVYGPGSFQYMVDTRGTTAMPQILGPSATPSLLLNVSSTPSTLNFVGPPQSFLELNSGLSSKEAGNRDVASLKHVGGWK